MPRITTEELLQRIATGNFDSIRLTGSQRGTFYMLLEGRDGSFIHEDADGSMKEYPHADYALSWLKRKTTVREVVLDIELWQADKKA
jgi:hypothetical protein